MALLGKPARSGSQAGFGMLETITGLVVFVILAIICTRAFHGVVANQKEASQVKALTDAVSVTAEKLSAQSVAVLTTPGSAYLQWSAPAEIGLGEYRFRYRTFPNPTVQGVADTSVVGLEVETGITKGNVFTPNRNFATLIAPHLSSKNRLGQVSTAEERSAEAAFYASLQQQQADTKKAAFIANQDHLNSFNCYDKTQCCGFMRKYFADPAVRPVDGVDEKCLYRCALGGAVPMKDWRHACSTDFCAIAPWQTQDQCCNAIKAGDCQPGSACSEVCIDCVGEDGSDCGPPVCDAGGWWSKFFDCADGVTCDGSPIPTGDIAGWGNVKNLCGTSACAGISAQCDNKVSTCCQGYWAVLNQGGTPPDKAEICRTISKQSDCCGLQVQINDWDQIYCGTDGNFISGHNKIDGKWYCGMGGQKWNDACAYAKGCASTARPDGYSSSACTAWHGASIDGPWAATYPDPDPSKPPPPASGDAKADPPATPKPKTVIEYNPPARVPSKRRGSMWSNWGGRE